MRKVSGPLPPGSGTRVITRSSGTGLTVSGNGISRFWARKRRMLPMRKAMPHWPVLWVLQEPMSYKRCLSGGRGIFSRIHLNNQRMNQSSRVKAGQSAVEVGTIISPSIMACLAASTFSRTSAGMWLPVVANPTAPSASV